MKQLLQRCLCIFAIACTQQLSAQSVAINDDASLPHASAILDIKVSAPAKNGVLLPRMTAAQRSAIASPAKGLLVYDSTSNSFWFHNGTAWQEISKGVNAWTVNGTNVYNLPGNIGIGVTTARAKLNVVQNSNVLFGASMTGLGRKLFWNGTKGAFRAGEVLGQYPDDTAPYAWDDINIGYASFATGIDVVASGRGSAAFGQNTDATGDGSIASGVWTTSSGQMSLAFGFASGASGEGSLAIGYNNGSSGDYSSTFGEWNSSVGFGSFTAGSTNTTTRDFSSTFGIENINNAQNCMTIGEFSAPLTAVTGAAAPLFVIGNGIRDNTKNAFVALRSGIVSINKNPGTVALNDGYLQVKQTGTRHALTLEASTTTNKWSFYVTPALTLYYNNSPRGTFNSSTGAYVATSDIRLKKDINQLAPVLQDIMRLKTYTYHLLDNAPEEPISYGLMAQELQQVFPDMVSRLEPGNEQSLLGINYSNFGVLAIKAIQEQQQVIDAQGKLILAQEERLATLEKLVNDLKTVIHKQIK
jgi:hypothetical protein